ncbi:hypothetical protein GCM10023176_16990 [Micromonospora coerulea]|uniref:Lipoprotein n=1 Tax=Micromonospora coerulea TaxID=47856 RepID=A0ABP8SCF1_9ACTN
MNLMEQWLSGGGRCVPAAVRDGRIYCRQRAAEEGGMKAPRWLLLPAAALMALGACTTPGGSPEPPPPAPRTVSPAAFDQALHDELIGMLERDQADRTGRPQAESDQTRTARLKDIIREHGWPTVGLVGEDGEDAASTIAQHSDFDPAFQQEVLELLRAAVADGQASPGNLAYLEDRVAVGKGEPQVYGTQIRCGPDGAAPATPLKDEAAVDQRRAEAGLGTLASYLAEMTKICADDGT